mgnify:CR=1 FL=1
MDKVYVFEGKTSTEAIEKGLKELKVSKNKVDIKILEQEDKRSFFSILTPRVVKVEMKLKENVEEKEKTHKKVVKTEKISNEEIDKCIENLNKFLDEFISKLPNNNLKYTIIEESNIIKIDITGEDTGYLIGYRGEVLNSIQTVVSNIASNHSKERIRVILNIGGYREKREKDLQVLATKIAGTVIKTKKSITLEPMPAYERKVIHTKLQENDRVKTHSVGEEPYRKIVVSLNK